MLTSSKGWLVDVSQCIIWPVSAPRWRAIHFVFDTHLPILAFWRNRRRQRTSLLLIRRFHPHSTIGLLYFGERQLFFVRRFLHHFIKCPAYVGERSLVTSVVIFYRTLKAFIFNVPGGFRRKPPPRSQQASSAFRHASACPCHASSGDLEGATGKLARLAIPGRDRSDVSVAGSVT